MKSLVAGLAVALAVAVAATASPAPAAPGPKPIDVPAAQRAIVLAHRADRTGMPAFECLRRPAPLPSASSHAGVAPTSLAGGGAIAAVLIGALALLGRRRVRRAL
jgi:hypothetical protein